MGRTAGAVQICVILVDEPVSDYLIAELEARIAELEEKHARLCVINNQLQDRIAKVMLVMDTAKRDSGMLGLISKILKAEIHDQ